jgi:hypothetical protein
MLLSLLLPFSIHGTVISTTTTTTKTKRRLARDAQPSLLAPGYASHFLPSRIAPNQRIRATQQPVPAQNVLHDHFALLFTRVRVS